MTKHEKSQYLQLAIAAAREAGRIQRLHLGHLEKVEYKGEIDPVTEVDRSCENAIVRMIFEKFPDHDVLTEESPFKGVGSPWKWIIDPLDGTTNYLHGLHCFCVSVALEVEGNIVVGVVYDPIRDELFHAEQGTGAFLNGKQIVVSKTSLLDRGFLCTGFPYDVREDPDLYLSYFREFMIKSFAIRRLGSAALDLCYLAAGRFDGFWELRLKAWDVAAASLMIAEAGGRATDFRGRPLDIYSGEILASNGLIHDEMLQVMQKIHTHFRQGDTTIAATNKK